jgi:hypothetical protein
MCRSAEDGSSPVTGSVYSSICPCCSLDIDFPVILTVRLRDGTGFNQGGENVSLDSFRVLLVLAAMITCQLRGPVWTAL